MIRGGGARFYLKLLEDVANVLLNRASAQAENGTFESHSLRQLTPRFGFRYKSPILKSRVCESDSRQGGDLAGERTSGRKWRNSRTGLGCQD